MKLRKLTRKSILGFGKYKDSTVQNIIDYDKKYLEWVYFLNSHIDLFDDILDELGITESFRINKPSTSEDKWNEFLYEKGKNKTGLERYIERQKYKKGAKIRLKKSERVRANYTKQFKKPAINTISK